VSDALAIAAAAGKRSIFNDSDDENAGGMEQDEDSVVGPDDEDDEIGGGDGEPSAADVAVEVPMTPQDPNASSEIDSEKSATVASVVDSGAQPNQTPTSPHRGSSTKDAQRKAKRQSAARNSATSVSTAILSTVPDVSGTALQLSGSPSRQQPQGANSSQRRGLSGKNDHYPRGIYLTLAISRRWARVVALNMRFTCLCCCILYALR
jgi:hypothetical protein